MRVMLLLVLLVLMSITPPTLAVTNATAATTMVSSSSPPPSSSSSSPSGSECDPSYPQLCIPPPPPVVTCNDLNATKFRVVPPDPHNLDGDANGIGCEAPSRSAPSGSSSNSSTGPFIEHMGRLPGNGTGIQNNNTSVTPAVTTGATTPPVTKSDSLITATINGTRFTHNQTIAINGTVGGGGGGQAVPPGGSSGKIYVDLRDPHNQTVMYDSANVTTNGNGSKAPFSYKMAAGDGLGNTTATRTVFKPMNVSGLNYTLAVGYQLPQTSPSEVQFVFAYDHGGEAATTVAARSAGNDTTTTTTTAQEPIIPPPPVLDQPEEEDDGNDVDNDGGDDGSDDNNDDGSDDNNDDGSDDNNDDDSSDDNDDNDNNDDNNDDNDNEDGNDNSDDGDGNGGDGDGDNGNGGGDEEDSEEDGDDGDGEGRSTDNNNDNTDDTTEEDEDDSSGEVLTILKGLLRENRDVPHHKPPRWD
jgi:hypothetical protein